MAFQVGAFQYPGFQQPHTKSGVWRLALIQAIKDRDKRYELHRILSSFAKPKEEPVVQQAEKPKKERRQKKVFAEIARPQINTIEPEPTVDETLQLISRITISIELFAAISLIIPMAMPITYEALDFDFLKEMEAALLEAKQINELLLLFALDVL